MKNFVVTWSINVEDVESAREAAQVALNIQRRPDSMAVFFSVTDKQTGESVDVDLLDEEVEEELTSEVWAQMPVTARLQ